MTFKILPDQNLVESVCTGVLTDEDILNHDRALGKTEGFKPTFDHIVDLVDISEDRVTMKGLKELAENTPFEKSCRRAYITNLKAHEYRAGFIAILMNSPEENLLVTHGREQAYHWLHHK